MDMLDIIVMSKNKELSIVVPVYKCEDSLAELCKRLAKTLEDMNLPYEIILVDDGDPSNAWKLICELAKKDKNVIIITADNGAPTLDQFSQNLPNQFFTVGIAEQQMIGMACGMAVEGKKVYTYAIAPFVTTRVHEFNKLCLGAMNLPIVNLGVGAGYAYDIMGPTHHTVEDITIMRSIPNMKVHSPADSCTAASLAQISYDDPSPQYIRFDRTGIPDLYSNKKIDFKSGLIKIRDGPYQI